MSIWFGTPTLEDIAQLKDGTVGEVLGIDFSHIGEDFVEATMTVDQRVLQPAGILQGGVSVVLAESTCSIGASLTVDLSKQYVVGQKLMPTIFVQGFQATSLLHGPPRFHADVARRSGTSAYIINMTSWYVFRAAPWLYWITPNNWQLSVSDGTILVCVIHDVSSCPA